MIPVVALPGFVGDAREIAPLGRGLDRRFVAFDLPPGSPAVAAAKLAPIVRARAGDRYHVVAGSFGGLVAFGLPGVVSLVAFATVPGRAEIPPGVARLRRLLGPLPPGAVRALYRARLRRRLAQEGLPDALIDTLVAAAPDKPVLLGRLDGLLAWDVPPAPRVPMWWCRGAADREAPWPDEAVRRAWPHVHLRRVIGGHRPYASHPDGLLPALRSAWASAEHTEPAAPAARATSG